MLLIVDLATGDGREIGGDLGGAWPHELGVDPDGSAVLMTADRRGHVAVLRVAVADGARHGAWRRRAPTPTWRPRRTATTVLALRSTMTAPPRPVRLRDGRGGRCSPSPASSDDGHRGARRRRAPDRDRARRHDRGVVAHPARRRPRQPTPAPAGAVHPRRPDRLLERWHWRWNPHLLAERGYAVLLPDPGISTGYGQAFVDRGWGRWGEEPYTDLMAARRRRARAPGPRRDADGRRWAARSAATWPTGWPATPTASGAS